MTKIGGVAKLECQVAKVMKNYANARFLHQVQQNIFVPTTETQFDELMSRTASQYARPSTTFLERAMLQWLHSRQKAGKKIPSTPSEVQTMVCRGYARKLHFASLGIHGI